MIFVLCCALSLSHVGLFETPWTVALQAPLSMGILQAKILEWVATPSSRVSSQPRDRSYVSHITGRFFTIWATREATFIHSNFTATSRLLFDWMTGDYSPANLTQPKTSQLMWSLFPCQPLTHTDPHPCVDGWIFLTGQWQERTAVRAYYKTRSHGCKAWLHLSLS